MQKMGNLPPSRVRPVSSPSSDNPNALRTGCRQASGSLRHAGTLEHPCASVRRGRRARAGAGRASDMERRLVERINDARAAHGLRQLRIASGSARRRRPGSRHLMRRDAFHHGSLRSGTGEVLAWGTCGSGPPRCGCGWAGPERRAPPPWPAPSAPAGRAALAKLRLRRDGRRALPLGAASDAFEELAELGDLVAPEALALAALHGDEDAAHERASSTGLNGLVMYSRPPRSMPLARSRTSARAVRKTIGMSRVTGSSRSISATRATRRAPASSRRGG